MQKRHEFKAAQGYIFCEHVEDDGSYCSLRAADEVHDTVTEDVDRTFHGTPLDAKVSPRSASSHMEAVDELYTQAQLDYAVELEYQRVVEAIRDMKLNYVPVNHVLEAIAPKRSSNVESK
jgi:hypothetical protein